MIRVSVTGPESCGKTTLAGQLAAMFHASLVPEVSRDYLLKLGRPYTYNDVCEIARLQLQAEKQAQLRNPSIIICDTDLLVIKIWMEVKYGRSEPWIAEELQLNPPHFYFLCLPDIPWQPDALRENQHDREELLALYETELVKLNANYFVVKGTGNDRTLSAARLISMLIKNV